jgi:PAS domain S-box-containing protein
MAQSRDTGIGGSAARQLAVAGSFLLTLIGLLRLTGERRGLLESGSGVTMMAAASTVGVVLIAGWIGRPLDRIAAERDASAAELATMFARYRAATEGSLDAFFIFAAVRDEGGRIVDFSIVDLNPRAAALTGQSVETLVGRRIAEQFTIEQTRQFIEAYQSVIASGETIEAEFTVGLAASSMRLRQQIVKAGDGVAIVSRDVTERVRAREALAAVSRELEERNADLRDFASVVSHDIRAPLRRIQMYGEQLELDAGELLGEGLPLLQRIRSSAGKLEQLVAELLEYARVGDGDRPFQTVDLNVLIGEVLEDLEGPLRESGGSVELGNLPVISGEPVLLRQLFSNLIGNAIKFRRPDTVLRISVAGTISRKEDGQSWTEIMVSDNGIGFDQQYADRIFKIFERLHGDRDYVGTGIGLAICRKIALYHKGTIEATGRHGEGATFTLRLPRPAGNGVDM